jgi:hypothetical protein
LILRAVALASLAAAALAACGDDGAATTAGSGGGSSSSSSASSASASSSSGGGPIDLEPFQLQALDEVRIGSHQDDEHFQEAAADVDFGAGPFTSVKLIVDLSSTCFPFEQWEDDPPPEGENWPPSCDAFDRNFEMALFDPADPERPGIELVRAITPFGGPMHIEADVTDLVNGAPGAHRFVTHITTWSDGAGQVSGSDGGWTVSARFEVDPGPPLRNVIALVPLFYGPVTDPTGLTDLTFTAPEGTVVGAIEYRVTGHGGGEIGPGCIGPAEEFCRRVHAVTLDGEDLAELRPWRDDCEIGCSDAHFEPWDLDYCAENPCGLPASVRAPRANWCPGSVTPPILLQGPALDRPGEHRLGVSIPELAEGGTWQVSATFLAYGAL